MNTWLKNTTFSFGSTLRWMKGGLLLTMVALAYLAGSRMHALEASVARVHDQRISSLVKIQAMQQSLLDFGEALSSSTLSEQAVERWTRKLAATQITHDGIQDSLGKGTVETELKRASEAYASAYAQWQRDMRKMLEETQEVGQFSLQKHENLTKLHARHGATLSGALDMLVTQQLAQAHQDFDTLRAAHQSAALQFYALLGALMLLVMLSWRWLTQGVRAWVGGEPHYLVNVTRRIAQGQLDQAIAVDARDTTSALANLQVIAENLQENEQHHQHRVWIDEGLALINETVRNENSTSQLATEISRKMADYLPAQTCALYGFAFGVVDDSMIQRQKLVMLGSASHDHVPLPLELPLPSQLLKDAAEHNRMLRNKDLPPASLQALGTSALEPSPHFLIIPFQFKNQVRGVFVAKSRKPLTDQIAELMLPGLVAVGVAYDSAQNRENLLASLMDSHRLTNQLQENQEKLQQSQKSIEQQIQYVNGLFSSMQSGLIVVDDLGNIRDCNTALLKLTGLTRQEVIGQHSDILFDDDQAKLAQFLNSLSKSLMRLELMEPGSYLSLLNQTPLACIQIDAQGRIQFANSRSDQITGYFGDELIGQAFTVLFPSELAASQAQLLSEYLDSDNDQKTGYSGPISLQSKTGKPLAVELGLINHTAAGQRTVLAFIRNLHDLPWSVTITTTLNRLVHDDDESVVTLLKNRKGPSTPVRISSSIMFSARGIAEQTVINVHDVSSLIHKNEQIKLQNSLLEKTMDAMHDGVLRIDRSGALLSANPKALALLGYAKVHVLGHTLGALLPAHDNPRQLEQWVPEHHADVVQRLHDADPAHFWQRLSDMPYPILGFDATERVKFTNAASQALLGYQDQGLQGHHLLSLLSKSSLDELPQPVSLHSLTTQVTDPRELQWLKADETVSLASTRFFTVNTETDFWVIACLGNSVEEVKAQAMHAVQNVEWTIEQQDGLKIPVILTAAPMRDNEGYITGAVITMSDIREIKEKESENLRMVKKMEQSQRLDALGQLAAGVAHDFNNLLGMIQNHAELVEMKIGEGSNVAKNLSAILQATTRARDIVVKLNGLGRERPPEEEEENLATFELAPVIEETKSLLQASLKGIEIAIEPVTPDAAQVKLHGQSGNLQQVLVNLCVNASHAIGDNRHGRITISASRPTDKTVSVAVIDNGSGIPPETLPRIFEPFFTTKEVGKGTGLGLAMVRSIITRMGGSIECQSELGVGTSFIVTLPHSG